MSARGRVRLPSFAVAALGLAVGALRAQGPIGTVDVQVMVNDPGTVRVEERYVITPAPSTVELRALSRPCAEVGSVRIERDGAETSLVAERHGPWLLHRVASGALTAGTLRLTVRYDVRTVGADPEVPLLHLTEPIPQRDGEREGTVHVRVHFADGRGRVLFPHMASRADAEWSARYVAIPSFVQISSPGAAGEASGDCPGSVAASGNDGGLTWRFFLLVGIMAAWVPTYLAWARRSVEDEA